MDIILEDSVLALEPGEFGLKTTNLVPLKSCSGSKRETTTRRHPAGLVGQTMEFPHMINSLFLDHLFMTKAANIRNILNMYSRLMTLKLVLAVRCDAIVITIGAIDPLYFAVFRSLNN